VAEVEVVVVAVRAEVVEILISDHQYHITHLFEQAHSNHIQYLDHRPQWPISLLVI
jgi:hypothetical protein